MQAAQQQAPAGAPGLAPAFPNRRAATGAALQWTVVGALTLAGLALRLIVANQPLFADELSTYWIVTDRSLGGVLSTVHSDAEITPPLFFVLSWLTSQISDAPQFLRAPSLFAGVATIALVYRLGVMTVGRSAGLTAAALTAFSPFMIYYSAEARAYAVMMALVILSTLAMLVAVDDGRTRWWVAYGVASCAAVYSHYTCIFALGAQFLWLLWAHPEARRAAILANVGAVCGFLPWITGLRNDLSSPTADILSALSPFTLGEIRQTFEHWAVGYPYSRVGLMQLPGEPALVLLALALVLATAGFIVRAVSDRPSTPLSTRDWMDRRVVLIILLVVSVPVAEALVSAASTNLFSVRNLAASWPALALAMGALLVSCGARISVAAVVLAVTALGLGGVKMLSAEYQRPDHQATADFVHREAFRDDVVIDATGFLSPGPLTTLDTTLRPGFPVFRAGVPAERSHPFGFQDRLVSFAEAYANAAAETDGGRIFVVSTKVPASELLQARQEALKSAARNVRYRRVARRGFAGFLPAQVTVWQLR